MVNNQKIKVTLIVIVCTVVFVFGVKALVEYGRLGTARNSSAARIKGQKGAKIKIIEYIDFECPACAVGAIYLKGFIEKNPDLVRLEMKYFPLSMHKHSFLAAQYTECAARQDKFWPVHDLIVERQRDWRVLKSARSAFSQIINEAGLNSAQIVQCLNDPAVNDIIMADKEEGSKLGVRSTPSYVVNGKFTVGLRALKEELAKYAHTQ